MSGGIVLTKRDDARYRTHLLGQGFFAESSAQETLNNSLTLTGGTLYASLVPFLAGDVNGQGWTCSGPVDLALVKVTNPPGDAITLASGCTGRIARIEVDTRTEDGVKIQNRANAARDVTIGGGYVRCTGFSPGAHQDAVQAMGGARITFTGVTFDCLGNSNFFVNRAGSGSGTPTDIVCDGCRFGAKSSTTVRVNVSVRSGVRNSQGCVGRNVRQAFYFTRSAVAPVNSGNTVVPGSDPLCERNR